MSDPIVRQIVDKLYGEDTHTIQVVEEGRLTQGATWAGDGCYGHNTFWPDGSNAGHYIRELDRIYPEGTRIRVTTVVEVLEEPQDMPIKTNPWHFGKNRECACQGGPKEPTDGGYPPEKE